MIYINLMWYRKMLQILYSMLAMFFFGDEHWMKSANDTLTQKWKKKKKKIAGKEDIR